jgi:hypothetical protein
MLDDDGNELYMSLASAWEIAIKSSLRKLSVEGGIGAFLDRMEQGSVSLIPIASRLKGERSLFDFGGANKAQKKAITTTEGLVLITAGPGTGKTRTLVQRAIYLIKEKGVMPEELFMATFTEKAAKELTTRISSELARHSIPVNLNEMSDFTVPPRTKLDKKTGLTPEKVKRVPLGAI